MNSSEIFERLAAHLIATESSIGEVTLDIKTMPEDRPVFNINFLEDGIVKVKLINPKQEQTNGTNNNDNTPAATSNDIN